VQFHHDRVGAVLAPDGEPLLDPADPDEVPLVDAVAARDAQPAGIAGADDRAVRAFGLGCVLDGIQGLVDLAGGA
jgi:hypothetical protein